MNLADVAPPESSPDVGMLAWAGLAVLVVAVVVLVVLLVRRRRKGGPA